MTFFKTIIWVGTILVSSFLAECNANATNLGIGITTGIPSLIAFDLRYTGHSRFEAGIAFGSFPADRALQNQISVPTIPVDLQQTDSYYLDPSSRFSLTAYTPYLRYFIQDNGVFYLQLSYSVWRFSAAVTADLVNSTDLSRSSGVVSGNLTLNQTLMTPQLGWRFKIGTSAHFDFGFGVSVLQKTDPTLTIGGSLSDFLTVVPDAQASFDEAVTQAGEDIQSAVVTFRNTVNYLPSISMGLIVVF